MMIATATPPEHAAHLERTSVLAMLVYCVFLAGFFYALRIRPGRVPAPRGQC
jgi:hypothetical protein